MKLEAFEQALSRLHGRKMAATRLSVPRSAATETNPFLGPIAPRRGPRPELEEEGRLRIGPGASTGSTGRGSSADAGLASGLFGSGVKGRAATDHGSGWAPAWRRGAASMGASAPIENLHATARHAPECVVKVASWATLPRSVFFQTNYLTRGGVLPFETSDGKSAEQVVADWTRGVTPGWRYAAHIVVSMPAGTDRAAVAQAARSFAARVFEEHDYAIVDHDDEPHVHAHVLVRARNNVTGRQLRLNRSDLQILREAFAEELRGLGVEASATPRSTRAQGQKLDRAGTRRRGRGSKVAGPSERGAKAYPPWQKHARRRDGRLQVDEALADEIAGDLKAGGRRKPAPWMEARNRRLAKTKTAWSVTAAAVAETDPSTATTMRAFGESLSAPRGRYELAVGRLAAEKVMPSAPSSEVGPMERNTRSRDRSREDPEL